MSTEKISEYGELKLIKRLTDKRDKLLNIKNKTILDSYHDDAALQENTTKYTVLTTDMVIQHSDFPKTMTHYQMGIKSVIINISDILAMNATPVSLLISLALPNDLLIDEYDALIDGILDTCEKYNITLIGGDLSENEEIIINGIATGKINNNVKLQNNIQEGNLIAVTGEIGSPAAAYDLIMSEDNSYIPESEKNKIIKTALEPTIPYETATILRKYPEVITGMTDITDGLAVELGHFHRKNNGIGFEIYEEKIPYNKYIKKIAKKNNKSLEEYLLHYGEDFELLLTLDEGEFNKHKTELNNLYIIGRTTSTNKITLLKNSEDVQIQPRGYEHIKE